MLHAAERASEAVGTIESPSIAGRLREDVQDPGHGMPRDLTGDGVIDSLDHSTDYQILPVRVAWRGASGDASLELQTYLFDREE